VGALIQHSFLATTDLMTFASLHAGAPQWLRSGGLLVVEMGYTQGLQVSEMFSGAGLENVIVHKDLAGHDRFVSGIKP
jgi:release factor glutamine methyltransferase